MSRRPFALAVASALLLSAVGWRVLAGREKPEITLEEARARHIQTYGLTRSVRGRAVSPEGRPLKGVPVYARLPMPGAGPMADGKAVSDTEGRFEMRELGPIEYLVGAVPEGDLDRPVAEQPVDLRTRETATVPDLVVALRAPRP